jgi:hypothetical protein
MSSSPIHDFALSFLHEFIRLKNDCTEPMQHIYKTRKPRFKSKSENDKPVESASY